MSPVGGLWWQSRRGHGTSLGKGKRTGNSPGTAEGRRWPSREAGLANGFVSQSTCRVWARGVFAETNVFFQVDWDWRRPRGTCDDCQITPCRTSRLSPQPRRGIDRLGPRCLAVAEGRRNLRVRSIPPVRDGGSWSFISDSRGSRPSGGRANPSRRGVRGVGRPPARTKSENDFFRTSCVRLENVLSID